MERETFMGTKASTPAFFAIRRQPAQSFFEIGIAGMASAIPISENSSISTRPQNHKTAASGFFHSSFWAFSPCFSLKNAQKLPLYVELATIPACERMVPKATAFGMEGEI
jgi:hypothetical protein